MSILSSVVEPPLLSLLSSTNSQPLKLWSQHAASTSAIAVLPDARPFRTKYKEAADATPRGSIVESVVELASPSHRTTFIELGGHERLGASLPYLSFQLRRLGHRELSLEVGVTDARGVEAVIRVSTFKVRGEVDLWADEQHQPSLRVDRDRALLHLPLSTPAESITPWSEITMHLPTLMTLFKTLHPEATADASAARLPGQWGTLSYVRIHANCRLRRVWLVSYRIFRFR